jgi:beta-barrel assembly-enhancing protease
LRSATEPGATLFIAVPGFAASLIQRAPHLTASAERMRYLKPALGVVAGLAAITGVIWATGWSPAKAIAQAIPDRTWAAAGGQLASTFEKDYPGCTDPAGRAALDKLVKRLVDSTPDKRPITLHLANWGLVNAFAMPGRHLMLTRGLIRDAASPEEVAGVMGHEIGHALELHPEAGIVRQLGLTVGLKIIFAGASDSLQSIGGLLVLLKYTRDAERQADESAFALLEKAKISPKPLGDFFNRMAKKEGEVEVKKKGAKDSKDKNDGDGKTGTPSTPGKSGPFGSASEIFSSHPALAERAQNAKSRPNYPTEPIMTPAEWQALKAMCKAPAPSDSKKGTDSKEGEKR